LDFSYSEIDANNRNTQINFISTRELCLQITNEIKLLEIRKGINVGSNLRREQLQIKQEKEGAQISCGDSRRMQQIRGLVNVSQIDFGVF
jgi:hypothetical protein